MKFDQYGLIEMEQNGWPGSIGDSCAETFRYFHLMSFYPNVNSLAVNVAVALSRVITTKGLLRHPTAPYHDDKGNSWREDAFSFDQWAPLFLGAEAWGFEFSCKHFQGGIERNLFRTGNNQFVPLTYFTIWGRHYQSYGVVWDIPLYLQGLAMKYFPWRWNDGTKKIENTKNSSADWLNFVHILLQAERLGHTKLSLKTKKMFDAKEILEKIRNYYEPEPNSNWLVELYEPIIVRVFG